MTPTDLQQTIAQILLDEFEVPPERIEPYADLYLDLELDSLDAVDLVVALENRFGIKIPEQQMREVRTLQELHHLVSSCLPPP